MFSFKVHHSLSKSAERFIMALFAPLDGKLDDIKSSFDSKLAEFKSEFGSKIDGLTAEIADLKTRVPDPAEVAALEAKADGIKSAIDAAKLADEPAPETVA